MSIRAVLQMIKTVRLSNASTPRLPPNCVCPYVVFPTLPSLLPATRTRRRDLRRRHQIPNILLQELVIVIQLIMLLLHSLDTVKDLQQ